MVTHRPSDARQCILHQACGLCPADDHLGDAEGSELYRLADGQMNSERRADP
jgi:hypothetical protein